MPETRSHVSYSELRLFQNCSHRWFLEKSKDLEQKSEGIDLSFGTAIHRSIEFLKSRNPAERLDVAGAKVIFEIKIMFEHDRLQSLPPESKVRPYKIDEYLSAGRRILEHIDDLKELREGVVVYNEYPLYEKIDRTDEVDLKFKGFIDMVLKVQGPKGKTLLYIIDFKTCSWGWDRKKRSDVAIHHQLLLYKHFLCKKFQLDPKDVRTAFILLKKRPIDEKKTVELFTISAGPRSMERCIESLQEDITRMSRLDIQKNRKSCKGPYGDCPFLSTSHCLDD